MLTEDILNHTHEVFKKQDLAFINKAPVPIKVLNIKGHMITRAFFEEKGMLDYVGVCQGVAVAFDAKETNKISLPLSNISSHQIDFIEDFNKQNGLAFIICNFKKLNKFYLIPGEVVLDYHYKSLEGGRKSIPEKELEEKYEIKFDENRYVLNYLTQLNYYYEERKKKK